MRSTAEYESTLRSIYSAIDKKHKEEFEARLKMALPWLIAPSRWRSSRERVELVLNPTYFCRRQFMEQLCSLQVDVIAHALIFKHRWRLDFRSRDGTVYLVSRDGYCVGISDHEVDLGEHHRRHLDCAGFDVLIVKGAFKCPEEAVSYVMMLEAKHKKSCVKDI